jgi:subtilisin family serine protease
MKASPGKLFSLVVVLGLLVLVGTAAVPANSANDVAFVPAAGGPGAGRNAVVTGDAPSPSALQEKPVIDPNKVVRALVQLEGPPLASYKGGISGLRPTSPVATGMGKLNLNSPESQAYVGYLARNRAAFRGELARALPNAQVEYEYDVVLNGLAVQARWGDLDAIGRLPGVKAVELEREYRPQMDASLALIGLGSGSMDGAWTDSGLWAAVGGHANAGAGIKIADIDSGLDFSHPCFSPTGYTYPAGYPKYDNADDARLVTPKVIVARAYFRPDDPPQYSRDARDDPVAAVGGGHGTHTAGTLACNYGTVAPAVPGYITTTISGVAPKAYLMVYRVLYAGSVSQASVGMTPEFIAAIEDAVRDGADVVNNSWGATATSMAGDLVTEAYSAAVDAGVVVVFIAGNYGPGQGTISDLGLGGKFITVGATMTGRSFGLPLSVTSGGVGVTVPVTLTHLAALPGDGPQVTTAISGPFKYDATNALGCTAFAPGTFTEQIAVVRRGTCDFAVKVNNAVAAGATAVVIVNNVPGPPQWMGFLAETTRPSVMVAQNNGNDLINWYTAHPGVSTFSILPTFESITDPALQDALADFSSRGPTPDMLIKPDLVAPGSPILSAGTTDHRFQIREGTSMAAPHVTGAAALIKQLHPDWTPAQIKSALMTTAAQPASLGTDPTARGSGRLDLSHPHDPGLTFDNPSVSFGLLTVGTVATKTVMAKNVTTATRTYAVTAVASVGVAPVVPAQITVPANGTATFNLVLTAGPAGDAYGNINLTDGTANHTLHIPYWVRSVADLGTAQVLLIDDSAGPGCIDRLDAYTSTLTALGITYVVWTVDPVTRVIDFNQVQRYPKAIYFTGDNGCGGNLSASKYQYPMLNYLARGGRMLVASQDISHWYAYYGRTGYLQRLFGSSFVQASLFAGTTMPVPAVAGDNTSGTYLAGQYYDIRWTRGDGARNQTSVDEIMAGTSLDADAVPILSAAPVTTTAAMGTLGVRLSSEPTIERVKLQAPWNELGYRTEFLSFGLEGVNDDTGFNTRRELMDRLLTWLDDEVTITPPTGPILFSAGANAPITITVQASTSITTTTTGFHNSIVSYRWDLGDGTPIQVTAEPSVVHGYRQLGTYQVYVEAVDAYGHHAVAGPIMVSAGSRIYLPFVSR